MFYILNDHDSDTTYTGKEVIVLNENFLISCETEAYSEDSKSTLKVVINKNGYHYQFLIDPKYHDLINLEIRETIIVEVLKYAGLNGGLIDQNCIDKATEAAINEE